MCEKLCVNPKQFRQIQFWSSISFAEIDREYIDESGCLFYLYDIIPDKKNIPIELEIKEGVRYVLDRLSPKERDIITSYYLKGNKMREIANKYWISEARVSQIVHAALRKGRDLLLAS